MYRHHIHFYSKVSIFLLLFFLHNLWHTHPDLVQIIFGLPPTSLCGMSTFFSMFCSPLWHSGVIHSCIILLWIYTEIIVTATVNTIPSIIALLHVWAIRLITVVCLVSAPKMTGVWVLAFASWSLRSYSMITGIYLMC